MAGGVALVGGDEFRLSCREMDEALLKATGSSRPTVLIVPTAAERYPARAASNGVSHFTQLGADAAPLMVLTSADADNEDLISAVDSADLIYLTGGNPAYLLEVLSGSLLLEKLRQALERGAVLAGSSAGAMVMGSHMRYRQWREALGIVPGFVTLPHHEGSEPSTVIDELRTTVPRDVTVLGIDGASGALRTGDGWIALGDGGVTVYHDGSWRRFTAGQTVAMG